LRRGAPQQAADALYAALVAQARRPDFYARLGVPDTLDGRFEMIALHAFLMLRRLKGEAGTAPLAQALADRFVEDMDASLREMGAGDLGVGRRVRTMAQALYGRIGAYAAALEGEESALAEALKRNVYRTRPGGPEAGALAELAAYVRAEAERLAATPSAELAQGRLRLGPLPV
jgi:cytochrome b pre-mRNA-processing protein 3